MTSQDPNLLLKILSMSVKYFEIFLEDDNNVNSHNLFQVRQKKKRYDVFLIKLPGFFFCITCSSYNMKIQGN